MPFYRLPPESIFQEYHRHVDAHNAAPDEDGRREARVKANAIAEWVKREYGDVQVGMLVTSADEHVGLDQPRPMCGGMFLDAQ
jgi:hypothetical protein